MAATESGRLCVMPGRAVDDPRLFDAPFRLLAALGTYGNRLGYAWPKQEVLAARAGISRQMVNNHMQTLEALGYVQVIREKAAKAEALRLSGVKGQPELRGFVYRLIFDALPTEPETDAEPSGDLKPTGLFDSAKAVQDHIAPPVKPGSMCNVTLHQEQAEIAGSATPEVAPCATSNLDSSERSSERPSEQQQAAAADCVANEWSPPFRAAVGRLTAIGFGELQAVALVRKGGIAQVDVAFANADWEEARDNLADRPGYIRRCIEQGWPRKSNDPTAKARREIADRAERDRLRDQSIAARRNADSRLDQQISAETDALFEFTDSMPAGQFHEIATAVLKQKPHLKTGLEGRDWRRSKPLCRAVKAWREANGSVGLVFTEAAPC